MAERILAVARRRRAAARLDRLRARLGLDGEVRWSEWDALYMLARQGEWEPLGPTAWDAGQVLRTMAAAEAP